MKNNYRSIKTSVAISTLFLTTCLSFSNVAQADGASVDDIMKQLQSMNKQTAKPAETPAEPEQQETKSEQAEKAKPEVKEESKPEPKAEVEEAVKEQPKQEMAKEDEVKKTTSTIATEEPKADDSKAEAEKPMERAEQAMSKPAASASSAAPQRRARVQRPSSAEVKQFERQYMSLIQDILSEQKAAPRRQAAPARQVATAGGASGWIYLGQFDAGQWQNVSTIDSGSQLPQAGQSYNVRSQFLNLRKTRPTNAGMGDLVKTLRAGQQVRVNNLHRSSRNNYWANISVQ